MPQTSWVDDISDPEVIRFAGWAILLLAIAVATTALGVHIGEADLSDAEAENQMIRLGIGSGAAIAGTALLGGALVFRTTTSWSVVGTLPFVGGLIIGAGYLVTLIVLGQTEAGTASCEGDQGDCDDHLALGAVLLAVALTIPVGASFVVTYALKRLTCWMWRRATS